MKQYIIVKVYFKDRDSVNLHIVRRTLENLAKKLPVPARVVDYALIKPKRPDKKGPSPAEGVVITYEVDLADEMTVRAMENLLERKRRTKWFRDYSLLVGMAV